MGNPKYRVCSRCDGEGKIVNPAVSVWTHQDRVDDPEGFEGMLRGDYNVTCPKCRGNRVTTRSDEEEYRHNVEDARIYAMESGDFETVMNGVY